MTKINVLNKYDILIGEKLLDCAGEKIKQVCKGKRCCIVSDDNVAPLYAEQVAKSLEDAGYEVSLFTFPHGEGSKHIGTVSDMLGFFSEHSLTRGDFAVALGGGVVGDLAGFAAAIYLRGIQFVQIPTSLLAQIDSSVGGKTGCDLPSGKNLAGAFHHPSLVIIDNCVLKTLPDSFMRDGMGEMIKYGAIKSEKMFKKLEQEPCFNGLNEYIIECVRIKAEIVEHDFTEQGERALLNFGHTVGHAIERIEGFSGMSHGCAVAAGMCIITRAAEKAGLCNKGSAVRLEALCKKYGLPTRYSCSAKAIADAALTDKKRSGDTIKLVIIKEIGQSCLHLEECERLADWFDNCI